MTVNQKTGGCLVCNEGYYIYNGRCVFRKYIGLIIQKLFVFAFLLL